MRLTPFGEAARILRIRLDFSLKEMAEGMEISSSHLSGLEYGEKKLSQKHIDAALAFFKGKATPADLAFLRSAGEQSKSIVNTESLAPDARGLVAAFARRLQEGDQPTPEIMQWLKSHKAERKK
jgi:transcriptional regulator with XRE-family HTH domain